MRKCLYWPYIILAVPIALFFGVLAFSCRILIGTSLVLFLLLNRVEWWLAGEHKMMEQPLNPFNEDISKTFMRGFHDW